MNQFYIPQKTMVVITYAYHNISQTMLVNRAPDDLCENPYDNKSITGSIEYIWVLSNLPMTYQPVQVLPTDLLWRQVNMKLLALLVYVINLTPLSSKSTYRNEKQEPMLITSYSTQFPTN